MQNRRSRTWLLSLLLLSSAIHAETLSGRVVAVSDGDTITVLNADKDQHKIRVAGIDAPEKAQAFGNRSKQHLSHLVFGKSVSIEWTKRDRYGRVVGKIIVAAPEDCPDASHGCPKILDAGLAQVNAGLAWHYKQYAKEQSPEDREHYAAAEQRARENRVGLWRDENPVPPWEWRHQRR